MSYIRCLSNPEGLYIWSGTDNLVHIIHNVPKPHSSGLDGFTVPWRVFENGTKNWKKAYEPDQFQYRGMRIDELHVFEKTGKIVPDLSPCNRGCVKEDKNSFRPCVRCFNKYYVNALKSRYIIRLSYKNHFVHLWRVTWAYVVENVIRR